MGVKTEAGQARRDSILEYLKAFQKEHKYLPSVAQIAREQGVRIYTVTYHLTQLREQGKVIYEDGNMSRSLRLQ